MMFRKIAAAVLGIIVAATIVAAVEALGHAVYPVPPHIDFDDPVQFQAYVASLPAGAFLFVLSGWVLGTLLGGLVACFVSKEKLFLYSMIVGGFMLAAVTMNLIMIPHPLWFSITAVIAVAVITYLTGLIALSLIIVRGDA
jgi:hypothetical protein